jgi:hypothetical protein
MNSDRRRMLVRGGSTVIVLALARSGVAAGPAEPAVHIELQAGRGEVALRPGQATATWRYTGRVLKGDPGTLQADPGSYLGPAIRLRRGQRVRIDLVNGLPEPTTIHWHGLHVPDDMDGHPRHAIGPGQRYEYEFTVRNRAGTYWYHAHPHGRTGPQVYRGLAGLLLVSDDEEEALDLPRGAYDVPLVLQDRSFDGDNQLVYPAGEGAQTMGGMMGGGMMRPGGMAGMMARMMGVFGDELLVNGKHLKRLDVERRAYRFRLLNASNSRTYRLAWKDGIPLTVIGTDGGHGARHAGRACASTGGLPRPSGPVPLPLPHAGARGLRPDAQLPRQGLRACEDIPRTRASLLQGPGWTTCPPRLALRAGPPRPACRRCGPCSGGQPERRAAPWPAGRREPSRARSISSQALSWSRGRRSAEVSTCNRTELPWTPARGPG